MKKLVILMSGNPNSIGGVETYNYEVVNQLKDAYDSIQIIHTLQTKVTSNRVWPKNVEIVYFKLSKIKFLFPLNILKIKRLVKKFRNEDILVHSYYYLTALSKKNNGRITQIQHSNVPWIVKYIKGNIFKKILFRKGLKYVDYLIRYPGSDELLEIFKNIKSDNIVFPPHKVNSHTTIGEGVLWAGRIDNFDKNYDYAISVAKKLGNINFNFWGIGADLDDFLKKIEGIKNIKYHGGYNQETIENIYNGNYLQIITSNSEGFPIASLEARTAGLNVLARNTFSSAMPLKTIGIIDTAETEMEFIDKIKNHSVNNLPYDYIKNRNKWIDAIAKIKG